MRSWLDRRMTARSLGALLLLASVFFCTRGLLAFSASQFPAGTDVEAAYRVWAVEVMEEDETPYSEVAIEYPPASLPFVLAPQVASADEPGYRNAFVLLMLCVDVIGFLLLLSLARRRGSLLGPWIWTIAIFVLGPIAYLRLDLVPAVATIWMVTRADRDDWLGAGALLGFAIATKAYAIVLVPIVFVMCPRDQRRRFMYGLGALLIVPLIPFLFILGSVFREVIGYHGQRGIQIESLWGSLLFILRKAGESNIIIRHNFGAHHFEGGSVPLLKLIATVATLGVAGAGAWIARVASRKDSSELAGTLFTTITLVVAVATVFSPQFMIWVIALGAASASFSESKLTTQALLLIAVAGVTRLVYPTLHTALVRAESIPIIVVWFRNLSLLVIGAYAAVRQLESTTAPSTPASASEETP